MYQMYKEPEDYSSSLEETTTDDEDYEPYSRRTMKKTIAVRKTRFKNNAAPTPKRLVNGQNYDGQSPNDEDCSLSHFLANSPKYVNQIYGLYVQVRHIVAPKAAVSSLADFGVDDALIEISKLMRALRNLPEPLNSSLNDTEAWIQHVERSETADNFNAPARSTDASCQTVELRSDSSRGAWSDEDSRDTGFEGSITHARSKDEMVMITTSFDFYRQTESGEADDEIERFTNRTDDGSISDDELEQGEKSGECFEFDKNLLGMPVCAAIEHDGELRELLQFDRSIHRLKLLSMPLTHFVSRNVDIIGKLEAGIDRIQHERSVQENTLNKYKKIINEFGAAQLQHVVREMTIKSRTDAIYTNKRPTGLVRNGDDAKMTTRYSECQGLIARRDFGITNRPNIVGDGQAASESDAVVAHPTRMDSADEFYRETLSQPSSQVVALTNIYSDVSDDNSDNDADESCDSVSDLVVTSAYSISERGDQDDLVNEGCDVRDDSGRSNNDDEHQENGYSDRNVDDQENGQSDNEMSGCSSNDGEDQENSCDNEYIDDKNGCTDNEFEDESSSHEDVDSEVDDQENMIQIVEEGVIDDCVIGVEDEEPVLENDELNDEVNGMENVNREEISNTVSAVVQSDSRTPVDAMKEYAIRECRVMLKRRCSNPTNYRSLDSLDDRVNVSRDGYSKQNSKPKLKAPPRRQEDLMEIAGREEPSKPRERSCKWCNIRFHTKHDLLVHETKLHHREGRFDGAPRLSFKRKGSRSPVRRDEPRPKHFKQSYRSAERAPRPLHGPTSGRPQHDDRLIQRWSDDRSKQRPNQCKDRRWYPSGNNYHNKQSHGNYKPQRRYSAEPPPPRIEYRRARHHEADSYDPTIVFTRHGDMLIEYSDEEYKYDADRALPRRKKRNPSYEEVNRVNKNMWSIRQGSHHGRNPFVH